MGGFQYRREGFRKQVASLRVCWGRWGQASKEQGPSGLTPWVGLDDFGSFMSVAEPRVLTLSGFIGLVCLPQE